MTADALQTLVEAAILAPSGDNTQPWRFEIDESQPSITVRLDPTRDPSPMNAGQCMARVAIGCAVENMRQTADFNNWSYEIAYEDESVRVTFRPTGKGTPKISATIRDRATNRRGYTPTQLAADVLERLSAACPPEEETRAHWITAPNLMSPLCELIGRADGVLLSAPGPRQAFLEKVRFDQPANAVVEEGLSVGSLELPVFQRATMRFLPYVPDAVLQTFNAKRIFQSAALKLARSASGFCLITSSKNGTRADYEVGQVFERAWLALTGESFACQPAMSPLVLGNILMHGSPEQKRTIDRQSMERIVKDLKTFASQLTNDRPRALLRFGLAPSPTVRTGRLSHRTTEQ